MSVPFISNFAYTIFQLSKYSSDFKPRLRYNRKSKNPSIGHCGIAIVLRDRNGNVTLGHEALYDQRNGAMYDQLNGALYGQLKGALYGQLNGALYGQLNGALYGQLNGALYGQLNGALYGQLKGVLYGQLKGALYGQLKGALYGQLKGALYVQLKGVLYGKLKGVLYGKLKGALYETINAIPVLLKLERLAIRTRTLIKSIHIWRKYLEHCIKKDRSEKRQLSMLTMQSK